MASFNDWKLSSSESEDESLTKGVLLRVKNSRRDNVKSSDLDDSIYIPLSERLKARDIGDLKPDDDLPIISFTNPTRVSDKEKVELPSCDSISENTVEAANPSIANEDQRKLSLGLGECGTECVKSCEALEKRKQKKQKVVKVKKVEAEKRKALNAHVKMLRPEECMKYMECRISNPLVSALSDIDLLNELRSGFDAHCVADSFPVPCVRWRRMVNLSSEQDMPVWYDEPELMVVLLANDFMEMVSAHLQENSTEKGLLLWTKMLQDDNPASQVHLVCHGLDKWNSDMKKKQTRRKNVSSENFTPEMVEQVLVELQIECATTVSYTEKPEEVLNMIKQLTKSVAEAPYKRMKRQDIQFINEIPSVKVNPKTGDGLKKAWGQMLQQFHKVTPVMSSTITGKYSTLPNLVLEYESCGSDVEKAKMLLANIPVRRGVGTLQTNRRIGPELSYKIHKSLTSTNTNDRLY